MPYVSTLGLTCQQWREQFYWNEKCENFLKAYDELFRYLYQ